MIIELDSLSPDQTFDIGTRLGKFLRGNELILISGDLGAGKTLLAKGIAVALGIDSGDIVSPTFTLMNRYEGELYLLDSDAPGGAPEVYMYHLDLYRLGEVMGQYMPELDEIIDEGIVVVEWAQFLSPHYFKPANVIAVSIQTSADQLDWRGIRLEFSLDYIDL